MPAEAYNKYSDIFSNGTATMLTTYDWEVVFTKAPPILTGDTNNSAAADTVLNNAFKLRTVNWQAPDLPQNSPTVVDIRGHRLSQPGMAVWSGAVSFTAMDLADLAVTKYFSILETAMDDPFTHSTRGRSPNSFRFAFKIYRLNPQGLRVLRWNCDPAVLTDVNIYSGGDSTKQYAGQVGISFLVDHFTIQYPKSGPLSPTNDNSDALWTDYSSKQS